MEGDIGISPRFECDKVSRDANLSDVPDRQRPEPRVETANVSRKIFITIKTKINIS